MLRKTALRQKNVADDENSVILYRNDGKEIYGKATELTLTAASTVEMNDFKDALSANGVLTSEEAQSFEKVCFQF